MATVSDNTPVGRPLKDLVNADAGLEALTNLAYSVKREEKPKPIPRIGTRTSKFWFTLESTEDYVAKSKAKLAPKAIEHIDAAVEARLKLYKNEVRPALKENIEFVREFFLTELAPLTIASEGGIVQAKDVVQRLLDTEVDAALIDKFRNMTNRAAVMRLALFVLDYFKLPKEYLSSMFAQPNQSSEFDKLLKIMEAMPSREDMEKTSRLANKQMATTVEKLIENATKG